MKALGLQSLIYQTKDMEADTAWWKSILCSDPTFESAEYTGFDVGGYEVGLYVSSFEFPAGGITHLGVEDLDAAYEQLLQSGCTPVEEPVDVGEGIRMATVKNASDQYIGIIMNPHFKATE